VRVAEWRSDGQLPFPEFDESAREVKTAWHELLRAPIQE
jgi:hypothetical protein